MASGTQLGQVRGLGSAKHGAEHWIKHRYTAVANLVLMLWLVISLVLLPNYSFATMQLWLSQPMTIVPLALLILSVFSHFKMGLQVFIEDYVHDEGLKFASLFALTAYTWCLGAFALFYLAKIAFTGTPN